MMSYRLKLKSYRIVNNLVLAVTSNMDVSEEHDEHNWWRTVIKTIYFRYSKCNKYTADTKKC